MGSRRTVVGLAPRVKRVLPASVQPFARHQLLRFRAAGLHARDVMLVSYPKSGSTWLRFMLAHALLGQEADFDSIRAVVPPVGRHRRGAAALLPSGGRLVRTHEPLDPYLGAAGQPVVYLVRHGFDVILSYADHRRREGEQIDELEPFVSSFLDGSVSSYGPWHRHVEGAMAFAEAHSGPFLLVRYEDLRAGTVDELRRVLDFAGVTAAGADLEAIVAANTKDRMRSKEDASAFMRRRNGSGDSFVRPERSLGLPELLAPALLERVELTLGPALSACGYDIPAKS